MAGGDGGEEPQPLPDVEPEPVPEGEPTSEPAFDVVDGEVLPAIPAQLVRQGPPPVLDADSWDAAPPPAVEHDYRGRRRAASAVPRTRLIVALVLVATAAAVAIPWALTLRGPDLVAVPSSAPTGTADRSTDNSPSLTATPDASLLPAVGASPLHSSTSPPPPAEPPPTEATTAPPPTVALLSRGRPTATSALENNSLAGPNAVDGNPSTRWGSAWSDPQWISVDLGSVCTVTRVQLTWEVAYGRAYEIQTSNDNRTWTTVYTTASGDGGVDEVTLTATGRWVRVFGTQRGTQWGYSLWELEIYGYAA
jgi:F5/8 type C domain-containing protein